MNPFFITDLDAKILYANEALTQKTGFDKAHIIGNSPGKLWGGQMPKSYYQELWDTISKQKIPFTKEINNLNRNKTPFQDPVFIAPVLDEKLNIKYYIGLYDTTSKTPSNRKKFTQLFRSIFQKPEIADFFKLIGTESNTLVNSTKTTDLPEFLEQNFVLPIQEEFSARSNDKNLIHRAQKDHEEFSALYEKYHQRIFEYLYNRLDHDQKTAEDILQETFLKAFEHLNDFQISNATYLTYLFKIAHNLLVNHYRKVKNPTPHAILDFQENLESNKILKQQIWQEVSKLSKTEAQAFTLRYRDDLAIRKIAEQINKSENATKLILSRARKKIRKIFL